ncbi:hypothetical protein NEDG_01939 [Nematocida displodere]|uniref:Uncharacterized protein n=1 Tax=Nematocida displodere TaxID=1805483 RepID=A0A177EJV3_9MICR|nr:hypothetical protein NEDG_01939 [Nematocida displodere]
MSDRKFAAALEKQLELFKTATEWSDFVAYLTGLESILKMHKFSELPNTFLFYKRLSQCLNPGLPAGVHAKALGVYKIVLSRMTKESLSRSVDVLCLGLFSFYTHANISTVTAYLEVLKGIVEVLGESSGKIGRGIVMGVVMGLEEESGEHYAESLGIFQSLEGSVGKEAVRCFVWEVMAQGGELVPGCIAYLSKAEADWGGDRALLLSRGFASALKSKDVITLRKAFDMLLGYRAQGLDLREHRGAVTLSVLQLLLTKELSLCKRAQQWISLTLAEKEGLGELFQGLCRLYETSPGSYFKVLLAMHQGIQEAPEILGLCIVWTLSRVSEGTEAWAQGLFKVLNRRTVWGALEGAGVDAGVVDRAIFYGMLDTHARTKELPGIVVRQIEGGSLPLRWFSWLMPEEEEYFALYAAVDGAIGRVSPEHALKAINAFLWLPKHYMREEAGGEGAFGQFERLVLFFGTLWTGEATRGSDSVHQMIVSCLERIKGVTGRGFGHVDLASVLGMVSGVPYLFWRYNGVFDGRLQNLLVSGIIKRNIEHTDEECVLELEQAFYLAENIPEGLDSSSYALLSFLLSFSSSTSFRVRERVKVFIAQLKCFREVFKMGFARLNTKLERMIHEDKMVLVDCDYNRVLSGIRTLHGLASSPRLLVFLQTEDSVSLMDDLLFLSDVTSYVLADQALSIPAALFSMLMVYTFSEHLDTISCTTDKHLDEIEIRSLSLLDLMLSEGVPDASSISITPKILQGLAQRVTETNIRHVLKVLGALGIHRFVPSLITAYEANSHVRDAIITHGIEKDLGDVILQVFEVSCTQLSAYELSEVSRLGHILSHWLGPGLVLGCGCNDPPSHALTEKELSRVVDLLLWVYTVLQTEATERKKGCGAFSGSLVGKDLTATLDQLKTWVAGAYKANPHVFSESLIFRYSASTNISFTSAISEDIVEEVFPAVLRVISIPSAEKYAMLRAWVASSKASHLFESEKVVGTLSMLLAQAKLKLEDISILWFLSEFFTRTTTKGGEEIGLKALEVAVLAGTKLGSKRVSEADNPERLASLSSILEVVCAFVRTGIEKKRAFDLLAIWSALVSPCLKLPSASVLYTQSLTLCELISKGEECRYWRREFYEYILSERFFRDSLKNINQKMKILSSFTEPEKVADLVSRAGSSGFFIRESNVIERAALIKRLRFVILCAPFGEYTEDAVSVFGLVSEIFSSSEGKILLVEAYSLCRALCIKLPPSALISLWPIAMSEALAVLFSETTHPPIIALGALRLIDLVATLSYPETFEFRWIVEGLGSGVRGAGGARGASSSKRVPCMEQLADWGEMSLSASIEKVANHHLLQKHASETVLEALVPTVLDDLPEI